MYEINIITIKMAAPFLNTSYRQPSIKGSVQLHNTKSLKLHYKIINNFNSEIKSTRVNNKNT